uniref:VPS10 domain-containing protein n=1 Tax=Corethron hystrix TaxID=216773 RepID=A0A7S1BCG9_9STRA|mmetsp:Transcript_2193/g.4338  ORF Transcript_2193/g.4338 Transcript_2193/m.4338 type:complete len:904 (+) Transcript_2193:71-2782(+)
MLIPAVFLLLVFCVTAHQPHDNTDGLAVSPDGRVVFTYSRFRLYRSEDSGLTWNVGQGPGLPIKIGGQLNLYLATLGISHAYSQDKTVFVSGLVKRAANSWQHELYISRNGGASWSRRKIPGASKGSQVIVVTRSTVLVLIPSYGELFISRNYGSTFARFPGEGFSAAGAICSSSGTCVLFVGKNDGEILGSIDDGASWINLGHCQSKVVALAPVGMYREGRFAVHAACESRRVIRIVSEVSEENFKNVRQAISQEAPASFTLCDQQTPMRPMQSCFTVTRRGSNVLVADDVLFVSEGFGGAWKNRTATNNGVQASQWGLYRTSQRPALPTFTHVGAASVKYDTIFLGTQNGIFRSTDDGSVWKKMDIQLTSLTGIQVGSARAGKLKLAVCTYSAGCWMGDVSRRALQKGASPVISSWSLVPDTGRYTIIAMSPNFRNDNIMFVAGKYHLRRSVDGGVSFQAVRVPLLISGLRVCFQSVVFSPTFKNDGIVFAGGYNVGVVISRDHGATFERFWHATWPIYGGNYVKLAISPKFKVDQTLIVTAVTLRPPKHCTPCENVDVSGCENIPIKPGTRSVAMRDEMPSYDEFSRYDVNNEHRHKYGCAWKNSTKVFHGKENCYRSFSKNQGRGLLAKNNNCYHSFDKNQGRGARIWISQNGGETWKLASPSGNPGRWNGDVFLMEKEGGGIAIVGAESGWLLYNPTLTRSGWCSVNGVNDPFSNSKVGRNGLGVYSRFGNGTVLVGYKGTGTTLGTINSQCRFLPHTSNRGSLDKNMASKIVTAQWAFEQNGLPGSDHIHGLGNLIAFSPSFDKDGIAFGASASETMATIDRGALWRAIQPMSQVQSHSCHTMGCAICRTSAEKNSNLLVALLVPIRILASTASVARKASSRVHITAAAKKRMRLKF